MLSLQRLKSPLETVVECPAAKNSPENVIADPEFVLYLDQSVLSAGQHLSPFHFS